MERARNDVCWCGSGQKYKKCHLECDEHIALLREQGAVVPPHYLMKTEEQIAGIRAASQFTRYVLDMVEQRIVPGVTTEDINQWVHEYTVSRGAYPAPLNYRGFPKSVCTSVNEQVCHGIPDAYVLEEGDIINVDVTTLVGGYYGDASRTFLIGECRQEAETIARVARECMELGIAQVKPFAHVGDVGAAIEAHANAHGFSVVREYGGHGIGSEFHDHFYLPHYGEAGRGAVLLPNMVFTVEPMINAGAWQCRLLANRWTAVTVDGRLSAQWEHTVRVTMEGVEILSA
ncbi:MAG: type I methionyl aminopeptidase [Syntrophomonadaceae bacterium]|nr:type I methionyl aminopeptidase [Syntrophomonadaceae bacterium]